MNVIHIFPYTAHVSGGHSNAIRAFIDSQKLAGINAVAISPFPNPPVPAMTFDFPLIEVDSLWSLRWDSIAEKFGIRSGDSVVHFHSINRRFAPLMADLRKNGVPYTFTSHGQLGIQSPARWAKKFIYLNLVDRGVRRASGIQLLTTSAFNNLKYVLPAYRGNTLVQGNLIRFPNLDTPPVQSRADFGIPPDAFVLLYLGRIDVRIKGLDLLIETMSHLPERKFRLVLAGPDWEDGISRLKKLAEASGCRDRIQFLGPAYGDKKWDILRQSDLFVSPSRREAFGLAIAEAMACGLPVLTSETICLAGELRAADAATITSPEPKSIAQSIAMLANDRPRREALASNGKAWVQEHCSAERAGIRFRDFYAGILAKQNASSGHN